MVKVIAPLKPEALEEIRERELEHGYPCITVCGGTGCRVYGSEKVANAFRDELTKQNAQAVVDFDVKVTGCHGFCEQGPLVVIRPQDIMYARVGVKDVSEIVEKTIIQGDVIERLLYTDPQSDEKIEQEHEIPFYKNQYRVILDLNGIIDPWENHLKRYWR
jgi:NADH-quinone oxidoreductase subunit F